MPKATEVAAELRRIADAIETIEIDIPHAFLNFSNHAKDSFLALAGVMPRPINKSVTDSSFQPELRLKYTTAAITLWVSVPQSLTCTLVTPAQPAVYDCPSILSELEESEVTA